MIRVIYDLSNGKVDMGNCNFENIDFAYSYDGEPDTDGASIQALYNGSFSQLVSGFNGCFSIVFYDKRTGELYIGRDRLGGKQLYYSMKDGKLMISSDFATVFEFSGKHIDRSALQLFFSFQYVPEPLTIGREVFALRLGHYAKADVHGIEQIEYNTWKPAPVDGKDRKEFRKQVKESITKAVKNSLKGAENPAAFLSSGLDSSIITAIAAKDFPNMTTYTIAFDVPGFSEADVAERTAKAYGIKHETFFVTSSEFTKAVPGAVRAMGVPIADPSAVAVSMIANAAVGKTDVILSGEGSDELWGGYHVYRASDNEQKIASLPGIVKKIVWFFVSLLPEGIKGKDLLRRGCLPPEKRYIGNTRLFTDNEVRKIITYPDRTIKTADITAPLYKKATGLSNMDKMQYIDTNLWLPGDIDVVCGKGCSEVGLKCVTPFMDNSVTDLARTLTYDEKLSDSQNKVILREAFSDMLTEEVRLGKKKGYPVPVRIWLSGELNEWAAKIIAETDVSEYIKKKEALAILEKCRRHPEDPLLYRKAWAVVVFCIWYNEMVVGVEK